MHQTKGYTVIEILIVMAIAGIFLIVIAGFLANCMGWNGNQEAAQKAAEEFAKEVPNVKRVECVRFDTDNDGYISCTLFRDNADPLPIECAKKWTLNKGCRAPKMSSYRR